MVKIFSWETFSFPSLLNAKYVFLFYRFVTWPFNRSQNITTLCFLSWNQILTLIKYNRRFVLDWPQSPHGPVTSDRITLSSPLLIQPGRFHRAGLIAADPHILHPASILMWNRRLPARNPHNKGSTESAVQLRFMLTHSDLCLTPETRPVYDVSDWCLTSATWWWREWLVTTVCAVLTVNGRYDSSDIFCISPHSDLDMS